MVDRETHGLTPTLTPVAARSFSMLLKPACFLLTKIGWYVL